MTESYYNILGIEKNASIDKIKKAYKKLVVKWHPDKNPNNIEEATAKFKEIQEAYEVLKDPKKRQIYDTYGKDGLNNNGLNNNGFDMNDIFGHIFKQQKREVVPPVKYVIELTLEELYNGKEIQQEIERYSLCKNCDNTGNADKMNHKCGACKGRGFVVHISSIGPGIMQQTHRPCHVCRGNGKDKNVKKCSKCKGNCVIKEKYVIKTYINPGMMDGQIIGIKNCGNEIPSDTNTAHKRGLIELIIKELPHPIFKHIEVVNNHSADLCIEFNITLSDALCGFNRTFVHLDKRKLYINENTVIKDNEIKIIPNEGMPTFNRYRNRNKGDLYIKYCIKYPENLSNTKKKILYKCLNSKPYKQPIPPQHHEKIQTTSVKIKQSEEYHEGIPQECCEGEQGFPSQYFSCKEGRSPSSHQECIIQ